MAQNTDNSCKVKIKALEIRRRFNIQNRPATLKDFYLICEKEEIAPASFCFGSLLKGVYFQVKNQKFIFVSTKLKKRLFLKVCFHELGHHFLHRHYITPSSFTEDKFSNSITEREANLFADLLLKTEVRNDE